MTTISKPAIEARAWCQPDYSGKIHPRKFMVVYEDAEMRPAIFDDEGEAREHFERATINWNCYLFGLLPREPSISPPAPAVKVKPLEWAKHPNANAWRADTLIGTYQIWDRIGFAKWKFEGLFGEWLDDISDGEVEAKAAAQADYEARILSALAVAPKPPVSPADTLMEQMAEALQKIADGCSSPEMSIHDQQKARYSAWAIEIARAALDAFNARREPRT